MNENFEIQNTLVSRMDTHQARTLTAQAEMKAVMDVCKERVKGAIRSIRSELEETIKHRVEDVVCRPKDAGPPQGTDRED
jgi:hypothetical protein